MVRSVICQLFSTNGIENSNVGEGGGKVIMAFDIKMQREKQNVIVIAQWSPRKAKLRIISVRFSPRFAGIYFLTSTVQILVQIYFLCTLATPEEYLFRLKFKYPQTQLFANKISCELQL